MPLNILQQYATVKQKAKLRLKEAITARAQLDSEIAALQGILGDMDGTVHSLRVPKTSGVIKSAPSKRRSRKRMRRSPEQLKEWAMSAILAVKTAKNGAKKSDIEKAIGEKLPQLWVAAVEKHSGTKLKREGDKSTARYFIK